MWEIEIKFKSNQNKAQIEHTCLKTEAKLSKGLLDLERLVFWEQFSPLPRNIFALAILPIS